MSNSEFENPRLISSFDMAGEKLEAVTFMDDNPEIAAKCYQLVSKFCTLDYYFYVILIEVCGVDSAEAARLIGANWQFSSRVRLLKSRLDLLQLSDAQQAFFAEFFEIIDELKDRRHLLCHAASESTGADGEFRLRDRYFSENPGDPEIVDAKKLDDELSRLDQVLYATFKMLQPALAAAGGSRHYQVRQ